MRQNLATLIAWVYLAYDIRIGTESGVSLAIPKVQNVPSTNGYIVEHWKQLSRNLIKYQNICKDLTAPRNFLQS